MIFDPDGSPDPEMIHDVDQMASLVKEIFLERGHHVNVSIPDNVGDKVFFSVQCEEPITEEIMGSVMEEAKTRLGKE